MSNRGFKLGNPYQQEFPNYAETPKAVIAAIAFSFALMQAEDDWDEAVKLIEREWGILFDNEIVPQRPPK
jgi:hypothetical protein